MPLVLIIASFLAITVLSVGVGYALLRPVRAFDLPAFIRVPVAGGLGLAFVSWLTAFTGMLLGWRPWLWGVLAVTLLVGTLGVIPAWRDVRSLFLEASLWWRQTHIIERTLVVVAWAGLLCYLPHVLLPPTESDSVRSYLRHAQLLVHDGYLHPLNEDILSFDPMSRQMLSVIGYFVWGYPLARVFSITCALFVAIAVVDLGRMLFDIRSAMLSVPAFVFIHETSQMSITGKVDLLMALFLLLAILMMENAASGRSWGASCLTAGVFYGCAVGTKPTALLYLPILGVWFVRVLLSRTGSSGDSVRKAALAIGVGTLGALVSFSPWMLWGVRYFDHPFGPLVGNALASGAQALGPAQSYYGDTLDRLWLGVRMIPHLVRTHQLPALFAALALAGVALRLRKPATWWLVGAAFGVFIVFAYFSYLSRWIVLLRFVFPGVLLLSILGGVALAAIFRSGYPVVRWLVGGAVALFIAIMILRPSVMGVTSARIVLGIESDEAYRSRYLVPYEVTVWARDHWTWDDKVWSVDVTELMYFESRVYHTASSVAGNLFRTSLTSAEARCAAMDSSGTGWVLTGPEAETILRGISPDGDAQLAALVACCLDTAFVTHDSAYVVYRVRSQNGHRR